MKFDDLGLSTPLLRAVSEEGYHTPTPIQVQTIPHILNKKDILGCAQTGTGKTAAFGLPILQLLDEAPSPFKGPGPRPIRALILTPTRELALQISESLNAYGRYTRQRNLVIFGGVGQKPQTDALQRGTDILVATPGRLLDLMQQGFISLQHIEIFVLDEADRMLDMGFIHDVKKVIAKLPARRQSLFFSATMAPEIIKLASTILTHPEHVAVTPVSSTAETVQQAVYFVEKADKKHLLIHLLKDKSIPTVLVFTRTKHGANRLAKDLEKAGIRAEAIHGNKSQTARQNALQLFKERKLRALVATDIAARGIDIDELTHVVNFELPNVPETYVHRIGRTGRAGASGMAISFCETEERPYLRDIQKLIGRQVPVISGHDFEPADSEPVPVPVSTQRHPAPLQKKKEHRQEHSSKPQRTGSETSASSSKRRKRRYRHGNKPKPAPTA